MKSNNKGFSLVELLVSFAILGLVSVLIGVIMTSGSNMFSKNKRILDLQYKSQMASAQLNSLIQNCDGGVAKASNGDIYILDVKTHYQKGVTDGEGVLYVIFKGSETNGEDENTLYIREINVKAEPKTGEENKIAVTPSTIDLSDYTAQPFCSKLNSISSTIEDTSLDPDKPNGYARSINISLEFAEGSSTYTKNISESFRSRPVFITQAKEGKTLLDTLNYKVWGAE